MEFKEFKEEVKPLRKFLLILIGIVVGTIIISIIFTNIRQASFNKVKVKEYNILVTTQIGYDFAKKILDEEDDVNLLTRDKDVFGETYEVTPKNLREIRKADVIIYCGDEAEPWLKKVLEDKIKNTDKILINMCAEMNVLRYYESDNLINNLDYGETSLYNIPVKEKDEGKRSYTFWTNPNNAMAILDKLYENLSALSSQHVETYYENYINYKDKLSKVIENYEELKKRIDDEIMLCCFRNISPYFIQDLNIKYMNIFDNDKKTFEENKALLNYYIEKVVTSYVIYSDRENKEIVGNIVDKEKLFVIYDMTTHNREFSYIDLMSENILAMKKAY